MTRDSARDYFSDRAGAQLRGFDKSITISATVYLTGNVANGTGTASGTARFEYVNAANSEYHGNVRPTTTLVDATHMIDQAINAIRRTVDLIEGRIGNRSFDFRICHNSCHYSCHASRGRR